jgi:hypothetical protein
MTQPATQPATQTVFACTHINKEVSEDHYEQGTGFDCTCTMAEVINVRAASLRELLDKIGKVYCLTIDSVSIEPVAEDEPARLRFSRTEGASGDPPSQAQLARWKDGKLKLWVADYTFMIEVREVRPLLVADVKASGIKYDE